MNPDRPPTLDEYRALMASRTRPLTDGPIGSATAAQRKLDCPHPDHRPTTEDRDA